MVRLQFKIHNWLDQLGHEMKASGDEILKNNIENNSEEQY